MKYCIHCGTMLDDGAVFCTNCGMNPNCVEPGAGQRAQTADDNTNYTAGQPYNAEYREAAPRRSLKYPIMTLAFGSIGLELSIILGLYGIFGLLGVGLSVAGLILGNKSKRENPGSRMGRIGWSLSLAGIIAGGVLSILSTVFWGGLIGALIYSLN